MSESQGLFCCFPCSRPRTESYHLSDIDVVVESPDLTRDLPEKSAEETERSETTSEAEGIHRSLKCRRHLDSAVDTVVQSELCKQSDGVDLSSVPVPATAPCAAEEDIQIEVAPQPFAAPSVDTTLAPPASSEQNSVNAPDTPTFYLQVFEDDLETVKSEPQTVSFEPVMSAQELAAVVARLESVAVRLESVASAKGQTSAPASGRGSSSAPGKTMAIYFLY